MHGTGFLIRSVRFLRFARGQVSASQGLTLRYGLWATQGRSPHYEHVSHPSRQRLGRGGKLRHHFVEVLEAEASQRLSPERYAGSLPD